MPPGGDGFYYFSVFLNGNGGEDGLFDLEINGEQLCSIELDQQGSGDEGQASCSAAAYVMAGLLQSFNIWWNHLYNSQMLFQIELKIDFFSSLGDTVRVVYTAGQDTTPLFENASWYLDGFTGFRI